MATIPFVSVDRKTLEIVDRFFRQSVDEKDHRSSNYEDDTDKTVWVAKKASGSNVIESYEQTKTEIILVTDDTITLPTANEVLIEQLRLERNMLLRDSDKYMLDDWPHTSPAVKTAWVDYRQALRDMETITEDPENPKWPTKPSS